MNKLISKIVGVALGLSLAVGTGVAIGASGNKISKAEAAAVTASITFGNTTGATGLTASTTSVADSEGNTWAFSVTGAGGKSSYQGGIPQLGNSSNKPSAASFTWTTSASYSITAMSFGVSSGSGSGSGSVSFKIGGTSYNASNNTYSGTSETTITNNSINATVASGGSVVFDIANSNGSLRIYRLSITYEEVSNVPTIESVSLTGDMTKKSYTTVESWDKNGITANVSMSDQSSYSGSLSWSFDPSSPAAYAISNNGEVNSGTVKVTATANSVSGNKNVAGINVAYATVAQVTAATPASGTLEKVIAKGIVSQIDSIDTTQYYNATYYISDDGTTTDQYEVYRGKGVNNANFTNSNDLQVGDTVVVYGNVTTYSGTKEFAQGSYLLKLDRPETTDPSITINEPSFTMFVGDSDVTLTAVPANIPTGGSVKWVSGNSSIAAVGTSNGIVHAVAPGSTSISATIVDSNDTVVASNSITVTVVENSLEDGDTFIIKASYNETTYYFTGVEESIGTTSTTKSEAMILTAIEGETSGQFQLRNGTNYLSYSGSKNEIKTTTDDESATTLWTAINNGTSMVIENVNSTGRKIQFNYNNGSPRFACYTSNQIQVTIEKVVAPQVDSVTVMGDSTADAQGLTSITVEFLFEVEYVDSNNQGNKGVTVSVLNSNDEATGASVTSAPSNGAFSVTFTASDTYTVTVTSTENVSKSDSTEIVVSNVYVPVSTDYTLYSGTSVSGNTVLTEGDYIIYYDGYAANTTVTSSRIQYEEVTPNNDVITTNLTNIVWHIAPSGNYYTIYNAVENKYLAGTAKNNAGLIADGTDNRALWTVTISDGTFEFENLARSTGSDPNNKWLRNNGTYGFGCYATSTGGALSLYKKAYTAVEYASVLMNYLGEVCDAANGNTNVTDLTSTWAILSAEYALLDSTVKAELGNDSESTIVLNALSAYDYVVGKYNKTQGLTAINDFMNREPTPVGAKSLKNMDNNAALMVVIITAFVTTTFVGGYFFLRKKKEN